MSPLQATFDAAKHFGLTEDEVWETVDERLYEASSEAAATDYLDDISAALAARIIFKQRRSAGHPFRIADTETAR
jgi:hypothetical protein